jgi:hypothetical protein
MVEAGRPGQNGKAVMRVVAAQEAHEIAQPVGHLEAQHIAEPFDQRLVVGRVQHDVADLDRHAFPAFDLALVPRATSALISICRPSGLKKRKP